MTRYVHVCVCVHMCVCQPFSGWLGRFRVILDRMSPPSIDFWTDFCKNAAVSWCLALCSHSRIVRQWTLETMQMNAQTISIYNQWPFSVKKLVCNKQDLKVCYACYYVPESWSKWSICSGKTWVWYREHVSLATTSLYPELAHGPPIFVLKVRA